MVSAGETDEERGQGCGWRVATAVAGLLSLGLLPVSSRAAEAADELVIDTGEMRVTLSADAAWTIRSVDHGDDRLIIPAGGQGAVLLPKGGTWTGSAMSPREGEPVGSFTVTADGQVVSLPAAGAVSAGKAVVEKASTLGPYSHTAHTTIEGGSIVQRHRFVAAEDGDLKTFYAFIYSLTPKGTDWIAQGLGGTELSGTFTGETGHCPSVPCEWLAQYVPEFGKGTLVYFQDRFSQKGASTQFWDTKTYHKLLAQPFTGSVVKGSELDRTMVMRFYAASAEEWKERAAEIVEELRKAYPQKGEAMAPVERLYGEGVPEQGMFTCNAGDYQIRFGGDRAWTIFDMAYGGKRFGLSNGFYGTVMVPTGGNWWGTGHTEGGKEIVETLSLRVDGEERPVEAGGSVTGRSVTLLKTSMIWRFKATVEVTITPEHVFERTQLEATEDCELKLLYYFMHCYPASTTAWLAELADGSEQTGELTHTGTMHVTRDTRWVAQFAPDLSLGILSYTPRVISGPKSQSMIWDKAHYHKYYLRQNNGQAFEAGDRLDCTVLVEAVPGETGDWAATRTALEALREEFPPEL